ncbi:MAG: glycosyltransferase [Candidatus Sumerlaeia bacterium]|nr:glycosyltransferase [Candidatus Sumerlaeia bacterium]
MADNKKPRIVLMIGSLREGGAEAQLVYLVRGLVERGWDVAVMTLHGEGVRLEELNELGVLVFTVNLPRFRPRWSPLPWLKLPLVLRRTLRFLRSWNPDIIHAFLFWSHVWARLFVPFLPHQVRLITSRRQTSSDKRDSRLLLGMENWINKRANLVVANSRACARAALRKEKNLPPVIIVRNGIDLAAIDATEGVDLRSEFPALANYRRIGITVANLLPHKGYGTLLRAWKIVHREAPDAALLCIGADDGMGRELELEARRLGIDKCVLFAGARRDVPALLKGADFAVHASDDEGLPNAVMEYMACGLPVVATDVGGTGELVRLWKEGYLVPRKDPEILAERLMDLIISPSLCRRFGEAGRKRIEERFPLDGMIRRYIKIYKALK